MEKNSHKAHEDYEGNGKSIKNGRNLNGSWVYIMVLLYNNNQTRNNLLIDPYKCLGRVIETTDCYS